MRQINLLPWREKARVQRQREFLLMLLAGAILSALLLGYWHWHNEGLIGQQKKRNHYLRQETAKVIGQLKAIKDLEKTKKQLIARMKIISDLQMRRSQSVHLFDELVNTIPEGIYLVGITQKDDQVTVLGRAQSNAHISAYMHNIEASHWLQAPQLQVIEQQDTGHQSVGHFKLLMQQAITQLADTKDG